jgi:hypothetical protein
VDFSHRLLKRGDLGIAHKRTTLTNARTANPSECFRISGASHAYARLPDGHGVESFIVQRNHRGPSFDITLHKSTLGRLPFPVGIIRLKGVITKPGHRPDHIHVVQLTTSSLVCCLYVASAFSTAVDKHQQRNSRSERLLCALSYSSHKVVS